MKYIGRFRQKILLFVVLGVLLASGAGAQIANEDGQCAYVDFYVYDDGTTWVRLDLPHSPAWLSDARQRIEAALPKGFEYYEDEEISCEEGYTCFFAVCERFLRKDALSLSGELPVQGLRDLAKSSGYDHIQISGELPNLPSVRIVPEAIECSEEDGRISFCDRFPVSEAPPSLEVSLRYPLASVLLAGGVVLAASFLSLLWLFREAQKALQRVEVDPHQALLMAIVAQRKIALPSIICLCITAELSGLIDIAKFVLISKESPLVVAAIVLAPIFQFIVLTSMGVSLVREVQLRAHGIPSPFRKSALLLLFSVGMSMVMCYLGAVGMFFLSERMAIYGTSCLILGLVIALNYRRWLLRGYGIRFVELASDQIQKDMGNLMEKAAVRLKKVYLMLCGQIPVANAIASLGNNIVVTDALLKNLSRQEVNAVMAHEFAHLSRRHVLVRLSAICLVAVAILLYFGPALARSLEEDMWTQTTLLVGVLPLLSLGYSWLCRRQESTADRLALRLYPDAAAFARGLAKIYKVNLLPEHWGIWPGILLPHISLSERLSHIEKLTGIPRETLLAQPDGPSETYEWNESDAPLVSPWFKYRVNRVLLWCVLVFNVAAPALIALGVMRYDLRGLARLGVYGGGLTATFFVGELLYSFLAVSGFRKIKRHLSERLERKYPGLNTDQAEFVSIAPGDRPKIFEGFSNWDVGFIGFAVDCMWFLGDRTQFKVRWSDISEIRRTYGSPRWFGEEVVQLYWQAKEGETSIPLRMWPGDCRTTLAITRGTRRLCDRLKARRGHASKPLEDAPWLDGLPKSPSGMPDGLDYRNAVTWRTVVGAVLFQTMWAALVGVALGLLEDPHGAELFFFMVMAATALRSSAFIPALVRATKSVV